MNYCDPENQEDYKYILGVCVCVCVFVCVSLCLLVFVCLRVPLWVWVFIFVCTSACVSVADEYVYCQVYCLFAIPTLELLTTYIYIRRDTTRVE